MTYDIPELRLVGATRQIVLGQLLQKEDAGQDYLPDEPEDSWDKDRPEGEW